MLVDGEVLSVGATKWQSGGKRRFEKVCEENAAVTFVQIWTMLPQHKNGIVAGAFVGCARLCLAYLCFRSLALFACRCGCRGLPATFRTFMAYFSIFQRMACPTSNVPSLSPPLPPQWLRSDRLFSALLALYYLARQRRFHCRLFPLVLPKIRVSGVAGSALLVV